MNEMIKTMVMGVFIGLICYAILYGGQQLYYNSKQYVTDIEYPPCYDLPLEETVKCVYYNTTAWAEYSSSSDWHKVNVSDLKKNGGDCRDYTLYYDDLMQEYGFNTERVKINMDDPGTMNEEWHTFLVVSDKDIYCIIDQTFNYWMCEG